MEVEEKESVGDQVEKENDVNVKVVEEKSRERKKRTKRRIGS